MALVNKTVQVCEEVDRLLDLLVVVVADAKAGKSVVGILADLSPKLVSALAGLGQVGPEIADKAHLEATVGLKIAELAALLT